MDMDIGEIMHLLSQQHDFVQKALALNVDIKSRLGSLPPSGLPHAPQWHSTKPTLPLCCEAASFANLCQHEVLPSMESGSSEDAMRTIHVCHAESLEQPLLKPTPRQSSKESKSKQESHYFFPHIDDLQHTMSESLRMSNYCVENHYKEEGLWQSIARHRYTQYCTLAFIALNTVWIAVDTDYNKALLITEAPLQFQMADYSFTAYFSAEIFVRFMAFKQTRQAFQDWWFNFDLFLVATMLWETCGITVLHALCSTGAGYISFQAMRSLRMLRLVRVARTARWLRASPELMILSKSILAAIRSVMAVMALLSLVIYVYAIVFTQILSHQGVVDGFDTVPQALNSLLIIVLCGADSDVFNALLSSKCYLSYVLYVTYVLVALFTVMNMLIGILCGVVADVSDQDQEEVIAQETENTILAIARRIDADGSDTISKPEFDTIIRRPEVTHTFCELGIDIVAATDFAKFVFGSREEITFNEFRHLILQFRRSKVVTVRDLMDMRKFVSQEVANLDKTLSGPNELSEIM